MRLQAMRAAVLAAGCAMVLSLAANGCTQQPRSAGAGEAGGGTGGAAGRAAPRASAPAPGFGKTFLARGECGTRNRQRVEEVGCDTERAAAKVLARHEGPGAKGPRCPARTDFVLHITERRPAADDDDGDNDGDDGGDDGDSDSDGAVSRGYACMRSLEAPHPGDPGGGGGPRTVVGDCVYTTARKSEVQETPCAPRADRHAPEFTVVRQVRDRTGCPADTALFVGLGGASPVGCARRL